MRRLSWLLLAVVALACGQAYAACVDNITSYGAVGNGSTDNTTAINNAFAAAKTAGCSVEIPAGTFNYSNLLVDNGVVVFGLGSTSILQATNTSDEAFELEGSSPAVSNLVLLGIGATRTTAPQSSMIWVNGATSYTINNVLINGGSCTGIWDEGGSGGIETNITVENTLADTITNTNGASNILEQNDLVINGGDDGFSNNSYTTDGNTVNHITINQNTVLRPPTARGLEVSGGNTITFSNNYVDVENSAGVADMYISSETSSYQTQTSTNVTVTGNTFVHGGPNQGTVLLWAQDAANTVSNVTLNGNQLYDTLTFTGVQVAGAGTLSNDLIENTNAYINPVGFYSSSATGSGNSITQTNNTTFATTAYPGPIAPPLAGTVPIFSLPSGTYTLPQTVTLNEPTNGDTMNYCTTTGTTCTPATAYSSSITVSTPETVCALGINSSSVIAVPSAAICSSYASSGPPACSAVTSGMTPAQINSAIQSCSSAGGGTVNVGAGTYGPWTTTYTLPCNVTLAGPTVLYSQTPNQTATFQGSTSFLGWAFQTTAGCSATQAIQYLEWNGEQPTGNNGSGTGGGGFLLINAGTTNLNIYNNWLHGAYSVNADPCVTTPAVSCTQNPESEQIWFTGGTGSTASSNINIKNNYFGTTTYSGDCGTAMSETNTEDNGGYCGGVGMHNNLVNVYVENNIASYLEEPFKFFEGQGESNPVYVDYNFIQYWQRIGFETQSNSGTSFPTNMYIEYNVWGNEYAGGGGQQDYPLSAANGCTGCVTHADYNVFYSNVSTSHQNGIELWGDSGTTANYNYFSGYACNSGAGCVQWSEFGNFALNNNTFNVYIGSGKSTVCTGSYSGIATGGYWNYEKQGSPAEPPEYSPLSCTGNTYSSAGTGTLTSAAPSISPASGHFAGTQTVTLTNTGTNRDTNTSIWYTTDGSTPVPGSGTAKIYTAPFAVTATTTVNAVGMWGAINQPHSYPANYGYVPSSVVTATYTAGAQYYISTTGSDSNSGTSSGSPWLTPNHAVNCGDTITAASGTYAAGNFQSGDWGTVTCAAGNNVAWLQCATFDTCKISSTSSDAMWISKSYWGVQGWETTVTGGTDGACFHIGPSGGSTIHHIILANNVANGCKGGGFNAYDASTSASVDYITYLGNVAYNAASGTTACYSGFNVYQPIASDTVAGTHIYSAGNFSYDNVDGSPCSGGDTTDGEGINYDTFDFDQGGGTAYTQQAAIENNITVGNGSDGIIVENNKTGSSSAPVYIEHNTVYGNNTATNLTFCVGKGEIYPEAAYTVTATGNLAMTAAGANCSGDAVYAFSVANGNGTVSVSSNWLYSAAGNTTFISASPGFAYGTNATGTSPAFSSITIPGAPSCSGTANVPACMATLIANFTPTNTSAKPYGYQTPSTTSVTDALYPAWLCNVNLPSGLVTPGCGAGTTPTLTGGFQSNTGAVNTLAVGASPVQQVATGTYSDGNNRTLPDAYGNTAVWSSSNTAILSVSSTGNITCVATGTANSLVTSSPGGVPFNIYTWTCTAGSNPTLTGGFLGNTGSINTQVIGNTAIQFTATGTYSDGVNRTLPDAYGNTAVWSSSNGTILSVGSSGLVNCLTAGSANVRVTSSPGSVVFNVWGMTCSNPTQSGGYLTNPGSVNTIAVGGGTIQFGASVYYSNSPAVNTLPDPFGNSVTAWSIVPGSSTCGTVSGSGLFTPTTAGTCNVEATCAACAVQPTQWTMTVNAAATISSVSLATTGGVTGLLVGNTNQLIATCHYSDSTTTNCTTTDIHGNVAGSWTSTTPAHATVSSGGLATGVAAGTTTFTAAAGGHTSPALPLTILPNGTYTITITGNVRFSGRVTF